MNLLGQTVQNGSLFAGKHTIDISALPRGNYIINFAKQGEQPINKKFTKN
jgi:hypothetical protein